MIKKYLVGKIAIFIDAANILYSQKTLGWKIDYEKLMLWLKSEGKVKINYLYTGKVGSLEKQLKFIKRLEKLGYRVITKEVKFIRVDDNKFTPKANLDIELALDAYRLSDQYDSLLLFSGDSDFSYLIDLLKEKNKQVIVISTRGHISKELIERAHKYIDLRKLRSYLEFTNKKSGASENGAPEV